MKQERHELQFYQYAQKYRGKPFDLRFGNEPETLAVDEKLCAEDRLGLVKAELKCDQEPSTLDVANALIKRCQSTALIVTATPKGSKGSLGRGERAN